MEIYFKGDIMSSILGFPRIGKNRELKKALESFWSGKCSSQELESVAKSLRAKHWEIQKGLDYVCVNDFSLYDNVLDLAYALNAKPYRFKDLEGLEGYFAMARGHQKGVACEMTKWFNTNYHYVVPELSDDDDYKANIENIKAQYNEALALGYQPKISLIGLFTFFGLSKIVKGDAAAIFNKLKNAYMDLIDEISALGSDVVVEFSEPIFALGFKDNKELFESLHCVYDRSVLECVYNEISKKGIKAIVSTFFEHSNELSEILLQTDIYGIGLDFIYGEKNKQSLELIGKSNKVLYAGVIDGRNIWVADIESKLALLEHIATFIPKDRIVVSSSCSLLHVPFSKEGEEKIDSQILSWFSFAQEKIQEISVLESVFKGRVDNQIQGFLQENKNINATRKNSDKTNNKAVRERVQNHTQNQRSVPFAQRIKLSKRAGLIFLSYRHYIGSFPKRLKP